MDKEYQLIILGGGPAGLTAGIYAARNKLNTLLIEKAMIGGLANLCRTDRKLSRFSGWHQRHGARRTDAEAGREIRLENPDC